MIRHFQYSSFEHVWEVVLRPWFSACSKEAWREQETVAIVLPNSSWVAFIKQQLVNESIALLGVQFLTPGVLRSHLFSKLSKRPALAIREDLQLVAQIAAKQYASEEPIAQGILAEPSSFVKMCDMLDSCHRSESEMQRPAVQVLVREYKRIVATSDLNTTFAADRYLEEKSPEAAKTFSELLIFGFKGKHWPQQPLLKAALAQSHSSIVCTSENVPTWADQLWFNTWEEVIGPAEKLIGLQQEVTLPVLPVAQSVFGSAMVRQAKEFPAMDFRITEGLREEAQAIALQVMQYLASGECERLGVIFPSRVSPLAREVSLKLVENNITHHDVPGFRPGKTHAQILFETWCQFQKSQRGDDYLQFFRQQSFQGSIEYSAFTTLNKWFERAFRACMTDDLKVLLGFLHSQTHSDAKDAAPLEWLQTWTLLPDSGSFADYIEQTLPIIESIKWPEELDRFEQRCEALKSSLKEIVSKEMYLNWLQAVVDIPGRTRAKTGRETFSKVQLITLDEAVGQKWTHIILCGVNAGAWPPEGSENCFLSNEAISQINKKSIVQGRQGAGHEIIKQGYTYLLTPSEEKTLFEDNVAQLLVDCEHAAAISASIKDPEDTSRELPLSELFIKIYFTQEGKLIGEAEIKAITNKTHQACQGFEKAIVQNKRKPYPFIRDVYDLRRSEEKAFTEFSYSFSYPPESGLLLSCKAWEAAFKRPASVWYEHILKVRKSKLMSKSDVRLLTAGIWLHDWMNPTAYAEQLVPIPSEDDWKQSITRKAQNQLAAVEQAYKHAERHLPDWWKIEWASTFKMAQQFVDVLTEAKGFMYLLGEYSLPKKTRILLDDVLDVPVTGRIDLLLSDRQSLSEGALWIIDYKTGGDDLLSSKKLGQGDGLQIALYAMALGIHSAEQVDVSILKPDGTLRPQMDVAAIAAEMEVWQKMQRIHQTGCLGDSGEMRSEFIFTGDYPLATLMIDADILEKQQAFFHGKEVQDG